MEINEEVIQTDLSAFGLILLPLDPLHPPRFNMNCVYPHTEPYILNLVLYTLANKKKRTLNWKISDAVLENYL